MSNRKTDARLTERFSAKWHGIFPPKRKTQLTPDFTRRFSANWAFVNRYGQLGFNWEDDSPSSEPVPAAVKTPAPTKSVQRTLFDEPEASPAPAAAPVEPSPAPVEYAPATPLLKSPQPAAPETTAKPLKSPPPNPASTIQRQPAVANLPKSISGAEVPEADQKELSQYKDPVLPPIPAGQKYREVTPELMQALTERYKPLALKMARRYARYSGEIYDFYQEANLAILRAAETYNADKKASFSTYAYQWMQSKLGKFGNKLERGRAIGGDELPPESKGKARPEGAHVREITQQDYLEKGLSALNPVERETIRRLFGYHRDQQSVDELAEELGKSPQWVYNIRAQALRKLKEAMKFSAQQLMQVLRFAGEGPLEPLGKNPLNSKTGSTRQQPNTQTPEPATKPGEQKLDSGASGKPQAGQTRPKSSTTKITTGLSSNIGATPEQIIGASGPGPMGSSSTQEDGISFLGDVQETTPPVHYIGADTPLGTTTEEVGVNFLGDVQETIPPVHYIGADIPVGDNLNTSAEKRAGVAPKTTPDSVKGIPSGSKRLASPTPTPKKPNTAARSVKGTEFTFGAEQLNQMLKSGRTPQEIQAQVRDQLNSVNKTHRLVVVSTSKHHGKPPAYAEVNEHLTAKDGRSWNLNHIHQGKVRLEAVPRKTPLATDPALTPDLMDVAQKAKAETQNTSDNPGSNDLTQIRSSKPNQQQLEQNLSIAGRGANNKDESTKPSWLQGVGEGLKRIMGLGSSGESDPQEDYEDDLGGYGLEDPDQLGGDSDELSNFISNPNNLESLGGKDFFGNNEGLIDRTSYLALVNKNRAEDRREDMRIRQKNNRRNQFLRLIALTQKHDSIGRRFMQMWVQYNDQQTQAKLNDLHESRIPKYVKLTRRYERDRQIIRSIIAARGDEQPDRQEQTEPVGPPYYGLSQKEIESLAEQGIIGEGAQNVARQIAVKDGLWDEDTNQPTEKGLRGRSLPGNSLTEQPGSSPQGTLKGPDAGQADAKPNPFESWNSVGEKKESLPQPQPETQLETQPGLIGPENTGNRVLPSGASKKNIPAEDSQNTSPSGLEFDAELSAHDDKYAKTGLNYADAVDMQSKIARDFSDWSKEKDPATKALLAKRIAYNGRQLTIHGYDAKIPGTEDQVPVTIAGIQSYLGNIDNKKRIEKEIQGWFNLKKQADADPNNKNIQAGLRNAELMLKSLGVDPHEQLESSHRKKLAELTQDYLLNYDKASDAGKRGEWNPNLRDNSPTAKYDKKLREIINQASDLGVDFNRYLKDHGHGEFAFAAVPETEEEQKRYGDLIENYKTLAQQRSQIDNDIKEFRKKSNAHPGELHTKDSELKRAQIKIIDEIKAKNYELDKFYHDAGLSHLAAHGKRPDSNPYQPLPASQDTPESIPENNAENETQQEVQGANLSGAEQTPQNQLASQAAGNPSATATPPSRRGQQVRNEVVKIRKEAEETLKPSEKITRPFTFQGKTGQLSFRNEVEKNLFYLGHYLTNRERNPKFNNYLKNPNKVLQALKSAGLSKKEAERIGQDFYRRTKEGVRRQIETNSSPINFQTASANYLPDHENRGRLGNLRTPGMADYLNQYGRKAIKANGKSATVSFESKEHFDLFNLGLKLRRGGQNTGTLPEDSQRALAVYDEVVEQVRGIGEGENRVLSMRSVPRQGFEQHKFQMGRGENRKEGTLSFENAIHGQLFRLGAHIQDKIKGRVKSQPIDVKNTFRVVNDHLDLTPNQILKLASDTYLSTLDQAKKINSGAHFNASMPPIPVGAIVPVKTQRDVETNYQRKTDAIWEEWALAGMTPEATAIRDQKAKELSASYNRDITSADIPESSPEPETNFPDIQVDENARPTPPGEAPREYEGLSPELAEQESSDFSVRNKTGEAQVDPNELADLQSAAAPTGAPEQTPTPDSNMDSTQADDAVYKWQNEFTGDGSNNDLDDDDDLNFGTSDQTPSNPPPNSPAGTSGSAQSLPESDSGTKTKKRSGATKATKKASGQGTSAKTTRSSVKKKKVNDPQLTPDTTPQTDNDSDQDRDHKKHSSRPTAPKYPINKAIYEALGTYDNEVHGMVISAINGSNDVKTQADEAMREVFGKSLARWKNRAKNLGASDSSNKKAVGFDEKIESFRLQPELASAVRAYTDQDNLSDAVWAMLQMPAEKIDTEKKVAQAIKDLNEREKFNFESLGVSDFYEYIDFLIGQPLDKEENQLYMDQWEAMKTGIPVEEVTKSRIAREEERINSENSSTDSMPFAAARGTDFNRDAFTQRFAAHWNLNNFLRL